MQPTVTDTTNIPNEAQVPQPIQTSVPPSPPRRNIWIVLIPVIIVILIIISISGFLYYRHQQTEKYLKNSVSILDEESKVMMILKTDNLRSALNTTSSKEKADALLAQHIDDVSATLLSINALQNQYLQYPNSANLTPIDAKIKATFTLSNQILQTYNTTLLLRKKVSEAYDTLTNELEVYTKDYYSGGDRVSFIMQTQKISQLAKDGIVAMGNIEVGALDKDYYSKKLDFLKDITSTFDELNANYRTGNETENDSLLKAFLIRNTERNDSISKSIRTYVEKSALSKDFSTLEQKESEVKQSIKNYNSCPTIDKLLQSCKKI